MLPLATHKRLKSRQDDLRKALRCERSDHFRFLLSELLSELDGLDAKLAVLERRIAERMRPYEELLRRLCQIPGVRLLTAWAVVAENRHRYDTLHRRSSFGELGGLMSWQLGKRGQATFGKNPQGELLFAPRAVSIGLGGGSNPE